MKRILLVSCSLVSAFAWADEPTPAEAASKRVMTELVKPMRSYELSRSKFSRARLAPLTRRVRVLSTEPGLDAQGRSFFSFAIDFERMEGEWIENDIVGCAYVEGDLFVKRGKAFRPAGILLGKNVKPVEGVCTAGELANR